MWEAITHYSGTAAVGIGVFVIVLGVIVCWGLTLMGMPGNWCIVLLALLYELLIAPAGQMQLGWPIIGLLAVLAMIGEVLEFATGAVGVAKTGGSRRSAAIALVGSFVGGIMGAAVGLPIPVAGPIIGVLLFASVGALLGAVVGEYSVRRELRGSLKVGAAAFLGRMFGSVGKAIVGGVMVAMFLVSLVM